MKAYLSFVLLVPILVAYAYVLQASHSYDHSRAVVAKTLAEKTWEQKQLIKGYIRQGIREGIEAYMLVSEGEIEPEAMSTSIKAFVALRLALVPVEEGLSVGCFYGGPSIEAPLFPLASAQCAELVNANVDLEGNFAEVWVGSSYLPVSYIAVEGKDERFGLATRAYLPPSERIRVEIE